MVSTASIPRDDVAVLWQERQSAFIRAVSKPSNYNYTVRTSRHAVLSKFVSEPARLLRKRLFDLVVASMALLLFGPFLILIAIAIKLSSPGPVLFSQPRYGYRNRRFRIYKFRTMYIHLSDRAGTRQCRGDDDPRVTPIGRLLRSTSLDELPQLLNVILGNMSLVGPRPHVPGMLAANALYEELVPYYFQRHALRPGVTGLAQVSGCRGSTAQAHDAIERIDYDLEYIEKWSLWLDFKIILKTIRKEFLSGRGI